MTQSKENIEIMASVNKPWYLQSAAWMTGAGILTGIATMIGALPDTFWKQSWPMMVIYISGRIFSLISTHLNK